MNVRATFRLLSLAALAGLLGACETFDWRGSLQNMGANLCSSASNCDVGVLDDPEQSAEDEEYAAWLRARRAELENEDSDVTTP